MKMTKLLLIGGVFLLSLNLNAAESKKNDKKAEETNKINSTLYSGLKPRLIGPALTSGRISDIVADSKDKSFYYVSAASGGVWKTTNNGSTFTPIFDSERSFSIGCMTMDPNSRDILWVGTGENNSQRSVSYGDGLYKTMDGGKSWKKMGLEKSEHIAKILINPKNSNIVYVAAQGPLWGPGGDRGLYKTTDAGKTWKKVLEISENTGVTDIVMDKRNPDILIAASYQRRRHVWTVIDGGPESSLYKSTNGGETWDKINSGLPGGDIGRIGLAISNVNPDIVYAIVEASENKGGFYRSTNQGASWDRQSDYYSKSAQYYHEIYCDPKDENTVYSMDTYSRYTVDGGKTWKMLSTKERHVDDHAFFVDPENTNYLIIGGDGGLYESYDKGETWRWFENLPVAQFYRIQTDNSLPFYYVYGGTQDNNSLGGPSRTLNINGIFNQDWFFVVGGDGYEPQIDPVDPNIVYGQWQYGGLTRYDRKSGEMLGIKPQEHEAEELRWNWDTPLIISPHSHTRLYTAANKVFRSDDRGNTWKRISGDISAQIDRDKLPVMGRVWGPEAVAKNASTSLYGNSIALAESPVKENLLYVGTDDGLLQVNDNSGDSWTKIESFPGVPKNTYISDVLPSSFDENVVYASFNNHKNADFKPYLLKSSDKGKSWVSIASNLPQDEIVWCIAEDHINKDLLFCGTEYGAYFTIDGGAKWIKIDGLPSIPVKDIDIQKRENDLVLGTFGRGIYIIDDYSPLRTMNKELAEKEAHIFKIKDALMYIENESTGKNNFGNDYYRAENPKPGAVFTYYIKETPKSLKSKRLELEKKAVEEGKTINYPSFEQLKAEDEELGAYLLFTIKNEAGETVRILKTEAKSGIQRLNWDFRYSDMSPIDEKTDINKNAGLPVLPGKYNVSISKFENGKLSQITQAEEFVCKPLGINTLPVSNNKEADKFNKNLISIQGTVYATGEYLKELKTRVKSIQNALKISKGDDSELMQQAYLLDAKIKKYDLLLNGNKSVEKRNANQTPSITSRLTQVIWSVWQSSAEPTTTNKTSLELVYNQTEQLLKEIAAFVEKDVKPLESKLDSINAPWTQGRMPQLRK